MDQSQFDSFRKLVHQLTGVTIDDSRRSMLASRVGSRMRRTGIDDHKAYYQLVRDDRDEQKAFIDKVTTHETSFFRTPRIWQYISDEFLPAWYAKRPDPTCRVWSAAASSGEEPYSLAITLTEFARANAGFRFHVDASDISEDVIGRCQQGSYQERAVSRFRDTRPDWFNHYVHEQESGYQVTDSLRRSVQFFCHNLFDSLTKPYKYDLVLLRNVLIYFSAPDQARVLRHIRRAMRNDGVLIIGESESINNFDCGFDDVQPLIYRAIPKLPQAAAANG